MEGSALVERALQRRASSAGRSLAWRAPSRFEPAAMRGAKRNRRASAAARRCRDALRSRRRALDRLSRNRRPHGISVSYQGSQPHTIAGASASGSRPFDLAAPLRNAIDFRAPSATQQRIDERLARFAQPAGRLGVISRSGITAARKNWGDGSEARAFVAAMRRASKRLAVHIDGRRRSRRRRCRIPLALRRPRRALCATLQGAYTTRRSVRRHPRRPVTLHDGRGGIPTVGLWIAHHPDWYDEPNPDAIHLIGRYVRDQAFERRPATTTKPPSLQHRLIYLDAYGIAAGDVAEAARLVR